MKKILISYGNEKYYKSLNLLEESAYKIGNVDNVIKYTYEWLTNSQYYNNKSIKYLMSFPRGNGYWCWKPLIILETFKQMNEGDIVIYSDAGLNVIDNLDPLYKLTNKHNRLIFKLPAHGVKSHIIKQWCKRDTFVLMNADNKNYWNGDMTNGAVSVWTKTNDNESLLNEWLKYAKDFRIISDSVNICGKPNFLEFKDHRHDQSILSILRIKYNLELFRDPTQFGNVCLNEFTNSNYNQLFNHHRNKL